MKTILVTGSHGFVGRNLMVRLRSGKDLQILEFDTENSEQELADFLQKADIIFHLAGVNRPANMEDYITNNSDLTEKIINILETNKKYIPIVFTSSIQAVLDNPYGRSKKLAESFVIAYGQDTGAQIFIYRLPNLFGKWSRPNYNSVVSTFCYNITRNLPIQISNPDAQLSLVYIDDVIEQFMAILEGRLQPSTHGYCTIPQVFQITLQQLADLIQSFREIRNTAVLPNMEVPLTKLLYSTYLSYLETEDFAYSPDLKLDQRGWLFELIKSSTMGQIFVSQTKPGVTRGGHFHHTKVEKFIVLQGEAIIRFRNVGSTEIIEYAVSGTELRIVDIPPGYAHEISNIGTNDVITLFWACEVFDPEHPDTYPMRISL